MPLLLVHGPKDEAEDEAVDVVMFNGEAEFWKATMENVKKKLATCNKRMEKIEKTGAEFGKPRSVERLRTEEEIKRLRLCSNGVINMMQMLETREGRSERKD